jgi:hypothetical protein
VPCIVDETDGSLQDADGSFTVAPGYTECHSEATAHQLQTKVKGVNKMTGIYVYFDATGTMSGTNKLMAGDRFFFNVTYNLGTHWNPNDDSSAHVKTECSGRGACDRSSGVCQCVPGYAGPACERTTCPNDCSGHGICQSLKRFMDTVSDLSGQAYDIDQFKVGTTEALASVAYTQAFDANKQYSCTCDVGFRGIDCSEMECPSGVDPMGGMGGANGRDCSGRGICDYSTGMCNCASGYYGERCEARTTFV